MAREALAVLVALLIAALLGLLVWVSREHGNIQDTSILVALIVVTLIAYGVASGRLTEVTAPGGWGAKFRERAHENIQPDVLPIHGDMETVPKEGLNQLKHRLPFLTDTKPITLRLTVGNPDERYSRTALEAYLKALGQFQSFMFVVLV